MIAITGATGAIGSRVAALLADQDHRLRLLVRNASRAPQLDAEVSVFEGYTDSEGAQAALTGCDTMLLVSGRESADRVSEHRSMVEAAAAAGVDRIVYISFQGAAEDATFTFARDHFHTERLIEGSGLSHVFLRDSLYLAALAGLAGADGVIRGPAGDGAVAGVSHADVAAVAAHVLVDRQWDGSILDVTGPAPLTLSEVAEALTAVSGRAVSYEPETEDEAYASRQHYGAPDFEVRGWVTSYQAIATGELRSVSDSVERVTGRAPQSFSDYLQAEPASWAHLARHDPS